jgi:uncharacterized membrane protein YbhN (UPF0104 family)
VKAFNAILHNRLFRVAMLIPMVLAVVAIVWWRGPDWRTVDDAFTAVRWHWAVVAIALNLLSAITRAIAWSIVIRQAMPPPHPTLPLVFSAYSVGLFGNAVLPGRVGELARVAVLTRKIPGDRPGGTWAALLGTVVAHRLFDVVPSMLLVAYVLVTAKLPHWAITSLVAVLSIGVMVLLFGIASARRHHRSVLDSGGTVRRLVTMARHGLGVLHEPIPALGALFFQCTGWLCQLFAVYTAMRAFHLHLSVPAAALVLVLMNVAMLFPLWPGNVGLLQAAIALPLVQYGVAYADGFAFGIGLQAIEASVGVGVGLIFLGREGLSFAMLRRMPDAGQAEVPEHGRERARVPG